MEFNDGSQYRIVTDPAAQLAERQVYAFRAASAKDGRPYVDTAFAQHREQLREMPALLMYQFVWQNAGTPEAQAQFLINALGGELRWNEMLMLDIEVGGGITNPADFARRWLAVVEAKFSTRAWLYIPKALSAALSPVVGGRIVMAPRYSGGPARGTLPDWPHDVHQYTDQGYFPGCSQTGDVSFTALTVGQMLDRCYPGRNNMPTSYNGWSAAPGWSVAGGQLESVVVAGEPFSPGVRKGDVATVLRYVAEQLNARVQPVRHNHDADDWGYSYRANTNNPSQLSCHASGTAIDYNATEHPNGKSGTWTAAQKAEILRILAEVNNVVTCLWGYDEMHFEIKGNSAQVATAAAKIRGGASVSKPSTNDPNDDVLELGDEGPAVVALQQVLNRWYPDLPKLDEDGAFGPGTDDRVRYFQGKAKLTVDGQVGAASRAVLGLKLPSEYQSVAPAPSPDSAQPTVSGEIKTTYDRLPQSAKDHLGAVQTSELTTPDGRGRYNHFAGGSIYWTPEFGAWVVWGAVRDAWAANGWEGGPLGYPVSDEFSYTGRHRDGSDVAVFQNNFEHGAIVFADGVATVLA